MRVLLVGLQLYGSEGGIQRYLRRAAQAISELGHDLTILSLWDGPEQAPAAPPRTKFRGARRSKLRAVRLFVAEMVPGRPDVVIFGHVLFAPLVILARILAPEARRMVLVYGDDVWEPP